MKVILGSTSAIKLQAVTTALSHCGIVAEVIGVKAQSGIAEQPFDEETVQGAKNRARDADLLSPGADLVIAIESGIFRKGDSFFDAAIVYALVPGKEPVIVRSDEVEFPADAVLETISRGVETWTCGKVMAEWGLVAKHDDPHATLAGKPRSEFLNEAMINLISQLKSNGLL